MTLEEFFTLTEMKDGLTVPARVEELIAVMKTEYDCILKNAGDAVRQWSTVATVIAVTENKGCLDRFIRLDGLVHINRWLKDAQTFSGDSNNSLVEESILALLHALEKLGIDNDKLTSSGIYLTLRDLLSHKSNNIQDKAKAFLEHFKSITVSREAKFDSEKGQAVPDGTSQPENSLAAGCETPKSSSAINPDQKADVNQHVHQLAVNIAASSGCAVKQQSEGVEAILKEPDKLANHFSESDLKEVNYKAEYSARKETCLSERKSRSDSPDTEHGIDVKSEVSRLESLLDVANAEVHDENLPHKLDKAEFSPASRSYVLEGDGKDVRGIDTYNVSAHLPTGGICTRADDRGVLMNCTATLAQKTCSQSDESSSNTSENSSDDGSMLRNAQDNTYLQSDNVKRDPNYLRGSWGIEPSTVSKNADVTSKSSAMDLEYGMVDALEVACLVAKEVERQIAEEEQFGSFPEKRSRGDSFNGKKDEHADGNPSNESPVEKMSSVNIDAPYEYVPRLLTDDMGAEQENDPEVVSSQVTEIAPEAAKGTSEFDLNLDISSDAAEDDACNSVSNPIAVVSATRAVAVSGLPASPLKFEGALGWKGSAATSAFRPASQRRTDGVATIKSSRQGQEFVFDLNLTEDESLAEPSPRKSENLSFDLNFMSEDRDAPPFSPSLKPSSPMNFDLNDKPLNFNDTSDLLPFFGTSSSHQVNSYGGSSDNSAISIMGAKVKQNNMTFLHQAPISFFNRGRASEPLEPTTMSGSRPAIAPSFCSYNGIAVGPGIPFSPQMYGRGGSATYMVDPRVMGGAPPSTFQAPFAVQPSFTTNMVGPLPGPNSIGSFRPHLGFNPGFVIEGGSNRVDGGGFRQLFPGQGRSTELQLQPLLPGIGGKRKEPDGGWEFHHPPPYL